MERTITCRPATFSGDNASNHCPCPPSRSCVALAEATSAARDNTTSLGWPLLPVVRTINGSASWFGSSHAQSTAYNCRAVPARGRSEVVTASPLGLGPLIGNDSDDCQRSHQERADDREDAKPPVGERNREEGEHDRDQCEGNGGWQLLLGAHDCHRILTGWTRTGPRFGSVFYCWHTVFSWLHRQLPPGSLPGSKAPDRAPFPPPLPPSSPAVAPLPSRMHSYGGRPSSASGCPSRCRLA